MLPQLSTPLPKLLCKNILIQAYVYKMLKYLL